MKNRLKALVLAGAVGFAAILGGPVQALLGACGPFTDVAADAFCPAVLEVFYLGITTGTTATTYDPSSNVSRLQMAAFLARSVDRVLGRGSRRAAIKRFWTTQNAQVVALTGVGAEPQYVDSDGTDLWVSNTFSGGTVSRVRGSDGKLLETWTGAGGAEGIVAAAGLILVAGSTGTTTPGNLYRINPALPAGVVTTVASNVGPNPREVAFDGARLWTANTANGAGTGSVSIVSVGGSIPWPVSTVAVGFSVPYGMLYDGSNAWTTDLVASTLLKLDGGGAILQTVTVGSFPAFPVFDGSNIWVPNFASNSVSVVRASNGAVLATLTANGMNEPGSAAFDGQRILVTNGGAQVVSLWKAADLTPIGSFPIGDIANYSSSDGVSFWLTLGTSNQLARF